MSHREEKHGVIPLQLGILLPDDVLLCEKCYFHHKYSGSTPIATTREEGDLIEAMRSEREVSSSAVVSKDSIPKEIPLWKKENAQCTSFHRYERCVF